MLIQSYLTKNIFNFELLFKKSYNFRNHSKISKTNPTRRTHSEDVRERIQLLEKAMQKDNLTKDLGKTINKSDPNYGKPQQGTLTEFRGQKAHTHVHKVCNKILFQRCILKSAQDPQI